MHYFRCQRIVTKASAELTNHNVVYCGVMIRLTLIAAVILDLMRKDKQEIAGCPTLLQILTYHVILGMFNIRIRKLTHYHVHFYER